MKVRLLTYCAMGLFFAGCFEDPDPLYNEELLFTSSFPIDIPEYSYTDTVLEKTFTVHGDSSLTGNMDTLSARPTFAWEALNADIKSAAVFSKPIIVQGGEIYNVSDIVWKWNSSFGSALSDTIQYNEGKSVNNGTIVANAPLPSGHYYWAVWAWSRTGVYILFSSRETEFHVLN